jgi:hypothetical protein
VVNWGQALSPELPVFSAVSEKTLRGIFAAAGGLTLGCDGSCGGGADWRCGGSPGSYGRLWNHAKDLLVQFKDLRAAPYLAKGLGKRTD